MPSALGSGGAPQSTGRSLPLPPFGLRERVGANTCPESARLERILRKAPWWHPDPAEAWLRQGESLAGLLREQLPPGTSLDGARVLDFGCGAGRVMRHLVDDVGDGELHGVDIDAASIAWLREHASPPLHAARCEEAPGLPYPDGHFDLVYVFSVFTHLVEHWAGWLLELRRVLAPDGVLVASLLGRRSTAELGLEVPGEPAPAMFAIALGNAWDSGGPVAFHDEAWIAERWGRAFEIVSHAARAMPGAAPHDMVVARPRPGVVTEDALLAPGEDGPSEGRAQNAQLRLLRDDEQRGREHHEAQTHALVESTAAARVRHDARVHERLLSRGRRSPAPDGGAG